MEKENKKKRREEGSKKINKSQGRVENGK